MIDLRIRILEIRPVLDALEVIGGRWKFPILYCLCGGKKRFKDLLTDVEKITPKMLSRELKDMEKNGLLTRHAIATVPVTVEYEMTEYGQTLEPVMLHIQAWGRKHREKIKLECPDLKRKLTTGIHIE